MGSYTNRTADMDPLGIFVGILFQPAHVLFKIFHLKVIVQGISGGPEGKSLTFHCREYGFSPHSELKSCKPHSMAKNKIKN